MKNKTLTVDYILNNLNFVFQFLESDKHTSRRKVNLLIRVWNALFA
jgi:hypothetical protein